MSGISISSFKLVTKIHRPFLDPCHACTGTMLIVRIYHYNFYRIAPNVNSCVLGRVAPPCIIRESLVKLEFQVFHLLFQNNFAFEPKLVTNKYFQLNKYSSNIISTKFYSGHKHTITIRNVTIQEFSNEEL